MATLFDFKSWYDTTGLKKETSELLTKQDLDTKEALVLVTESDITNLEMALGQRELLVKAIFLLHWFNTSLKSFNFFPLLKSQGSEKHLNCYSIVVYYLADITLTLVNAKMFDHPQ